HNAAEVTQKDFRSLGASSNSAAEPGLSPQGSSTVQAGPTLPWPGETTAKKIAAAMSALHKEEAAFDAARKAAARDAVVKVDALLNGSPSEGAATIREAVTKATVAHYPFDEFSPVPDDQLPTPRPQRERPSNLVSPTGRRNPSPRPAGVVQAPEEGAEAPAPAGGAAAGRG